MTSPPAVVSLELVAAALEAADAEERRQATSLIAELVIHDALPLLVRALGDDDWRVRKEATIAARAFVPAPALVQRMIEVFEPGENVGLRNAAVEVLGICGSASTGPLALALTRLDADGRKLVVQALGATRDPHALVVLARALDDEDENVRQGAVEAIARLAPLAPSDAHKLLLRSLDGDDAFCQLAALEGLNALGAQAPWEKLESLIEHPTLRTAALTAAALSQDVRAPAALVRILHTLRGNAFLLAMTALVRMAEGSLLPEVSDAMETDGAPLAERLMQIADVGSNVPQVHRGHALLLASIVGAPGVVDAAAHALEDELLGEIADLALRMLGSNVLPDLIARIAPAPGLAAFSSDVRAALIEASVSLAHAPCPPECINALLAALRTAALENERRITTSALCALSRLGDEQDLVLSSTFVGSTSRPIAYAAEAALAVLTRRHPDAARRFATTLTDRAAQGSSDDACTAVIIMGSLAAMPDAAGQTFSEADMALLTRCATGQEPRTRRTAIEALAVIGGESALPVFGLALADDAREVRIAAARALGVLGHAAAYRAWEDAEASTNSLRAVVDLVTHAADSELLATTIRTLGEDIDPIIDDDTSLCAAQVLLPVLAPLAQEGGAMVAMAAVESIGRLPANAEGRQAALTGALRHLDDAVVKAALLKLQTIDAASEEIMQCLDHPSFEVRTLAAEIMAGSDDGDLRDRLAERTSVELDLNMRDKLEGALSSIRWRGERS